MSKRGPPSNSSPAPSADELADEPPQHPPKRLRTGSPAEDGQDDGAELTEDALIPDVNDGDGDESEVVEDGVAGLAACVRKAGTSGRTRITAAEKRAAFREKWGDTSPEDVILGLLELQRSSVYDHFKTPVPIRHPTTGAIMHRFVCKRHPSKHVDRSDYENSTGNLGRHILGCDPDDTPQVEQITVYAQGSTYSAARVRLYCAMWCARRHRPYIIVEDPEFRAMLRMLYGKVEIPKRMTVGRDVQLIHTDSKGRNINGRIHICIDGWTSPNVLAFLGITAHWHENGKIRHIILDFVRLTKAHTGKYLAEKVMGCLEEFGIEEKVLAVTCDNAENNMTMLKAMHVIKPNFRGPSARVRCFGHVLNLVVKAILSIFSKPRRLTNPAQGQSQEDDEDDEEDEDDDADPDPHANLEGDEAREAADAAEILELAADELDILMLSRKVWNSPLIREELSTRAAAQGLGSEVLIRAVRTRWNTVTEVLKRAKQMKEVLGDLCDMHQFNKKTGPRLRRFILLDSEWDTLDELLRLLDPFLYATKQISASERALVQDVIPYIDILTNHVDDFTKDVSVSPIVRAAARRGRRILDKYYKCTDETIIYRIAMILHPKHKLQYFRDQEWTEEWINNAVEVIRKEWRTHYKPKPAAADVDHQTPSGKDKGKGKVPGPGRRSAQQSQDATIAMFATVNGSDKAAKADALESYLESPQQTTVTDPLEHWNLMLQTPEAPLARMALDYLSVPATSTDAERAFSRGHLTVSRLRHALNDSSVRAGTVLGSWANIPDLVPEAEVVDLLKAHARKSERAVKDTVSGDTVSTAAASSQQAAVSTAKATSSKTAATSVKGKARAALSAAGSTASVARASSSVARAPSSNTRGRASSLNARASSSNARASSSNAHASSSKSAARSKGSRAIVITDSEEDTE
ncbi:hypothetical protein TRAPUB_12245 [Trametes pubescens]|uniref:HAT C-terminal dimerisation domain-containing protein n=1 Tax=Trametes pubescens TaxID=154538 RepID=A0A1M2VUH4_TRAPU|nr:hypothetical protein TRAPUB_12245 [Trametes pubescens]